jgi:hypothetical protein
VDKDIQTEGRPQQQVRYAHVALPDGMNQRMLARSSGGFTTCLVLTVSAAGTLTAANAGHIAPYVNGRELTLANGLPLASLRTSNTPNPSFRLQRRTTHAND